MSRKVSESSIRWILNYRASKCPLAGARYERYIDEDGHSGGSYAWVVKQSKLIDSKGWDAWWLTDGPLGYGHAFDRFMVDFLPSKQDGSARKQ